MVLIWIKHTQLEHKFQVHYPAEAIQKVDFSESKTQLLEAQVSRLCLANDLIEIKQESGLVSIYVQ